MTSDLHPTRYFAAATHTLEYLLDEWADDPATEMHLHEAMEIVAEAEGDIFEERSCPDCVKIIQGTDQESVEARLKDHRRAIHG